MYEYDIAYIVKDFTRFKTAI